MEPMTTTATQAPAATIEARNARRGDIITHPGTGRLVTVVRLFPIGTDGIIPIRYREQGDPVALPGGYAHGGTYYDTFYTPAAAIVYHHGYDTTLPPDPLTTTERHTASRFTTTDRLTIAQAIVASLRSADTEIPAARRVQRAAAAAAAAIGCTFASLRRTERSEVLVTARRTLRALQAEAAS